MLTSKSVPAPPACPVCHRPYGPDRPAAAPAPPAATERAWPPAAWLWWGTIAGAWAASVAGAAFVGWAWGWASSGGALMHLAILAWRLAAANATLRLMVHPPTGAAWWAWWMRLAWARLGL